jgi:hypothetical protein
MIGFQKRYVYAAIPGAITFIVLYGFLNFYLWISLLLAALAYCAGIFLFRGKDLRQYDPQALARYQFDLSRLNQYKEKIADKQVKERMGSIVEVCQNLTAYLETKPSNATPIYNSLDYYLTFATRRIVEYMKVEKVKEKSFTENQLMLKMNVYLREIDQECNKLYKEVIKNKDKQINYEMKRFEMLSEFEDDDERSSKK